MRKVWCDGQKMSQIKIKKKKDLKSTTIREKGKKKWEQS